MTTREPDADGERILWRSTADDPQRSGTVGPPRGSGARDRPAPAPAAGRGDGSPAVRRRAVLKGFGGGAVAAGLAGCPTDGTGGTESPGSGDGDDGQQTDTQCFEKKVDCPDPCDGQCEFRIEFTYDYERADDGTISISRFRLEFVESTSDGTNCSPEFLTGTGTFEFDVAGEQPCSVDLQAVFECDCGMTVQFEDHDPDDNEDCVCPNFQQTPPPDCGEPVWIEKTGDFESITIDFQQMVICSCQSQANTDSMNVQIRFQDGELAFGGDTADC